MTKGQIESLEDFAGAIENYVRMAKKHRQNYDSIAEIKREYKRKFPLMTAEQIDDEIHKSMKVLAESVKEEYLEIKDCLDMMMPLLHKVKEETDPKFKYIEKCR